MLANSLTLSGTNFLHIQESVRKNKTGGGGTGENGKWGAGLLTGGGGDGGVGAGTFPI